MADASYPGVPPASGRYAGGRRPAPAAARARRGSARAAVAGVWSATPRAIWNFVRREPASFWFLNLYLFMEYVRPQSIYTSINVAPWAQIFLALGIATMFLDKRPVRLPTVIGGLMVFFTLVLVASSITAWSPEASFAMFNRYFGWAIAFVLIVNIVTNERRFFVFMLAFFLYSFKMSQHGARGWLETGFGFRDWGVTGGPGWFQNSGEFGIQMCIFFPLSLCFLIAMWKHWGKWKRLFFLSFPVTAVMSMIASSSRGALVGGALVLGWMALRSQHRVRAIVAAALVAVVVVTVIPEEQKERFSTAGEDKTSESRLELWRNGLEITSQYPVLGIGYANWSPYSTAYYGRPLLPHNVFIEAMSELGYVGLFAFVLLIGATFVVNFKTRKVLKTMPGDNAFLFQMAHGLDGALIGFIGSGFFVTVLYYPFFWINLAMTVALHVVAVEKAREVRRTGSAPGFPGAPRAEAPPAQPRPQVQTMRIRPGPRGGWR